MSNFERDVALSSKNEYAETGLIAKDETKIGAARLFEFLLTSLGRAVLAGKPAAARQTMLKRTLVRCAFYQPSEETNVISKGCSYLQITIKISAKEAEYQQGRCTEKDNQNVIESIAGRSPAGSIGTI